MSGRLLSQDGTHTITGELGLENHGPDASPSILILPSVTTLPAIAANNGQVVFVYTSGILAITQNGIWRVRQGVV